MIGRIVRRVCVLAALVLGGAGAADAQSFDFSYTSNGMSVAGTFVTMSEGNGQYLIQSIMNGKRGIDPISLLAKGGYDDNDNILYYPASPGFYGGYFDTYGFSYVDGSVDYNLKYEGGNTYYEFSSAGPIHSVTNLMVRPAGAPAPVPGGGLLSFLALGLAGLAYRCRSILDRRRRRSCVACSAGTRGSPSTH